jgi:ketosteroid isomerase-like protein
MPATGTGMGDGTASDTRLEQTIALLRRLLAEMEGADGLTPWRGTRPSRPARHGRISATDQLSWWFRPASTSEDPWDDFFADDRVDVASVTGGWMALVPPDAGPEPPSPRMSLRLLLSEPEEELFEADADSVVTCLYDFVHAIGRSDLDAAMACVAADFHTLEDDRELDRDGLAARVKSLLDSLQGWETDIALVEVPQPVLHPAAILVYAELQIDARRPATGERRTVVDRRVAVFSQQRDRSWRIVGLSPV